VTRLFFKCFSPTTSSVQREGSRKEGRGPREPKEGEKRREEKREKERKKERRPRQSKLVKAKAAEDSKAVSASGANCQATVQDYKAEGAREKEKGCWAPVE
jgi:hypothetical protein